MSTSQTPAKSTTPGSPSDQTPLAEVLFDELARSGKWLTWCAKDARLEGVGSLEDAVEGWQRRRDPRSYSVVAALTSMGSRRGGDDDDAALAVLLLLESGIVRLTYALRDVCELDDVRRTVWEEVKRAEPQLGNLAARYLLRRARQRLTRPAWVSRHPETSLDQRLGWADGAGAEPSTGGDRDALLTEPQVDDPVRDLVDVLSWARETGVIEASEVDLLVELVAQVNAGAAVEDAQRLVGQRYGVGMRTIRRRRDSTLTRLREAAPRYLAATA